MDRRTFSALLATALSGASCASARPGAASPHADGPLERRWQALEKQAGGLLGVTLIDPQRGQQFSWRGDERFPMCSTFKWPLAAALLAEVDAGRESLDRVLTYSRDELLPHSPVSEQHVASGMRVGDLCAATVAHSDNTAANVLLRTLGGPAAFNRFVRSRGDNTTLLARNEPEVNDARHGDAGDTTSPRAMASLMQRLVLGDGLSARSREQLKAWGLATVTSGSRLRANLPAGWQLADKTGTSGRGSTNDVGVFWTPAGRPIVVAAFLTASTVPAADQNRVHAHIAAQVFERG
ncbi:class A beta-lactamase [Piscinibacter gummiphilus]|uniref:Beta-lactamase n=1 Tax=Piscinibacter gummiphilus TaxID=946333 RepID=A0ABZ0CXN8_9BURK|nr:class A beta-lactamase [Piscinibacter gummiphilus]WOB09738.1 class A beta-lactamase [Piscinibacter gummiphilus]